MEPIKLEVKREADGTFAKGTPPPNPNGRPKGKTLKEFAREMLMSMSDEEKREYLKQLPPEIVWRMSEGNPHTTSDITSKGEHLLTPVPILGFIAVPKLNEENISEIKKLENSEQIIPSIEQK